MSARYTRRISSWSTSGHRRSMTLRAWSHTCAHSVVEYSGAFAKAMNSVSSAATSVSSSRTRCSRAESRSALIPTSIQRGERTATLFRTPHKMGVFSPGPRTCASPAAWRVRGGGGSERRPLGLFGSPVTERAEDVAFGAARQRLPRRSFLSVSRGLQSSASRRHHSCSVALHPQPGLRPSCLRGAT